MISDVWNGTELYVGLIILMVALPLRLKLFRVDMMLRTVYFQHLIFISLYPALYLLKRPPGFVILRTQALSRPWINPKSVAVLVLSELFAVECQDFRAANHGANRSSFSFEVFFWNFQLIWASVWHILVAQNENENELHTRYFSFDNLEIEIDLSSVAIVTEKCLLLLFLRLYAEWSS